MLEIADALWIGGVDTDPAWSPKSFSRARHCYTKRDNGLLRTWYGRVWLNPPWSLPMPWVERLLEHVRASPSHEVLFLVRNDPSTAWFKLAAHNCNAICFAGERTRYYQLGDDGAVHVCGTPEFGSVLMYFGPQPQRFVEECRKRGHLAFLHDPSDRGTVPCVPRKAETQDGAASALREAVRASVATFVRNKPDATLLEIQAELGTMAHYMLELRVRDFWPIGTEPTAPPPRNGNGHGRSRSPASKPLAADLHPLAAMRANQLRAFLANCGATEITTNEVMEALECSRQTALRALAVLPEVTRVGNMRSAKYKVKR
jgi:hypothetical protein